MSETKRGIISRIEKLAKPSFDPKWKIAIIDQTLDARYHVEGLVLDTAEFEVWLEKQDRDCQVIVIEVMCNVAGKVADLKVTVDTYKDKNVHDLLAQYAEICRLERESGHCLNCHQPLPKTSEFPSLETEGT